MPKMSGYFVGIFAATLCFVNTGAEECSVSGDPRDTPASLNNDGGGFFNLFTAMNFTKAGWITKFDYFAHSPGGTYLSIWSSSGSKNFKMRGKIHFQTQENYNEYRVPYQDQIQVHVGDMVGVHFQQNTGTLKYERTGISFQMTPGIDPSQLSDTYIKYAFDTTGSWKEDHEIFFNGELQKRGVALRVFTDCCSESVCGRPCPPTCKNSRCENTSAQCIVGCSAGYMGPFCDQECRNGRYGENCNSQCSEHCSSSSSCDRYNGDCVPGGCEAGYGGNRCDTECDAGSYGANCASQCSTYCASHDTCDRFNGYCAPGGCVAGYQGSRCDTDCEAGSYGANCSSQCSTYCAGHDTCDRFNGDCVPGGCVTGYQGSRCDIDCEAGSYGANCASQCSTYCASHDTCDRVNGDCAPGGCVVGYQGSRCDTECAPGLYGRNCTQLCGYCANGDDCKSESGHCPGTCEPGYKAPICKELCEGDSYGQNCSNTCHCRNYETCDSVNGTCPNGCAPGFQGRTCSSPMKSKKDNESDTTPSAGMIGGITVAVLITMAIVVIVAVVIRKKKAKQLKYLEANIHFNLASDEAAGNSPRVSEATLQTTKNNETPMKAYMTEATIKDEAKSVVAARPAIPKKPDLNSDHKTLASVTYSNVASIQELSKSIDVTSFKAFMVKEKSLDYATLKKEYMMIPTGQTAPWDIAKDTRLILKNKFKNILPYDKNRVVLRNFGDDPLSHYINASFVDGYTKENKFIASHGPRDPTQDDFGG